jgi:hypothetical protein
MDVFDTLHAADEESFLDVAYAEVYGRPADADASGLRELARSPSGRWQVTEVLLHSVEAELMQLRRRVTPLASRMLRWIQAGEYRSAPPKLHVAEDVDQLTALRGRELVDAAYGELLGRQPEPGILATQVAAAERSVEKLTAALLLSVEYGLSDRRAASPLVKRWSWWVSSDSDRLTVIRDIPVEGLANAAGE